MSSTRSSPTVGPDDLDLVGPVRRPGIVRRRHGEPTRIRSGRRWRRVRSLRDRRLRGVRPATSPMTST
jgi:hypothetical protein